jgi:hypothetical protein
VFQLVLIVIKFWVTQDFNKEKIFSSRGVKDVYYKPEVCGFNS